MPVIDKFQPQDREFILTHAEMDPKVLLLQAKRYPGVNVPLCASQIESRKKIRHKLPAWYALPDLYYPNGLSLEQASSQTTALYKARLIEEQRSGRPSYRSADLTGGLGIDSAYIAQTTSHHTYIERNPELCEAAEHNFSVLGLTGKTRVLHRELTREDLTEYLQGVHCIYLDPARRSQTGGRVFSIADCEPNLLDWKDTLLQTAETVWVKLSPMIDLKATLLLLPEAREVHILSVSNEVKELLIRLEHNPADSERPRAAEQVPIHCIALDPTEGHILSEYSFTLQQEQDCPSGTHWKPENRSKAEETGAYTAEHTSEHTAADFPRGYLYEPDKSILKGGAFKCIGQAYRLEKLSTNTHLYFAPHKIDGFPGKVFRILQDWEFNKRSAAELSKILPDNRANVTARNFPLTSEALQTKLKLTNGDRHHVFCTTLDDRRKWMLLTEPLTSSTKNRQ